MAFAYLRNLFSNLKEHVSDSAFLRGASSVFTIYPESPQMPAWWYAPNPDAAAIGSDWAVVGNDLEKAIAEESKNIQ